MPETRSSDSGSAAGGSSDSGSAASGSSDVEASVAGRSSGAGRLLRLAGALVGAGVLVGVLWYLVAPTPAYRVGEGGLYLDSSQPSEFIAMDGWFGLLGLVAGTVVGVLAVRWGCTGVRALLLLGPGGFAAALLAWGVGRLLGPDEVRPGGALVRDTILHGPLDLEARGVLAAWPIASLVVVILVLGWRRPEPN